MKKRIQPSYEQRLVDDFFRRHGPTHVIQFLRGPLDGLEVGSSSFKRTIVLPINAEIVDRPQLLAEPEASRVPANSIAIYQLAVLNDKLYYAFRGASSDSSE